MLLDGEPTTEDFELELKILGILIKRSPGEFQRVFFSDLFNQTQPPNEWRLEAALQNLAEILGNQPPVDLIAEQRLDVLVSRILLWAVKGQMFPVFDPRRQFNPEQIGQPRSRHRQTDRSNLSATV